MSRIEFAEVITWIAVAVGKGIADREVERSARLDVYYESLGDLPLEVLWIAARRYVLTVTKREYGTFPSIADLRVFAFETMHGELKAMTGGEAFGIARRAMGRCDVEVDGDRERAFANVPLIINAAINQFGFMEMYNMPDSAIESGRAQFIRIFDAIAERERMTGILPQAMQQAIAKIGEQRDVPPALEAARKAISGKIGVEC